MVLGSMNELLKFLRYGGVGVAATALHYGVLVSAVELAGVPAPAAAALGALAGAILAYLGNRYFTFLSNATHGRAVPRFAIVALLGAGVSAAVVAGAVATGWPYLGGQVLATLLVLLLGFVLNRTWTFA